MVSRVAVIAGARHHGSLRSVFSAICARVLEVIVACVMPESPRRLSTKRGSPPALPINLFQSTSTLVLRWPFVYVTLATFARYSLPHEPRDAFGCPRHTPFFRRPQPAARARPPRRRVDRHRRDHGQIRRAGGAGDLGHLHTGRTRRDPAAQP